MLKGILLIATGSPYYGRMAYNLAVSIKAVEDIPICILYNGAGLNHLSEKQKQIFDHLIEVNFEGFSSKLEMFDWTPFEHTLYLDVDTVWLAYKKPSQLFEMLKDVEFTGITEGFYDFESDRLETSSKYYHWCDPKEAEKVYGLKSKMYRWRSEFIIFKKTKKVEKLFDTAKKIYKEPKVDFARFANQVPDELAFNISCSIHDIHPHAINWSPTFWHRLHGNGKSLPEISHNYWVMSVGGNYASELMKQCYNSICSAAHKKLKLQYLFTLQSKKAVIKERAKM